MVGRTFKQGQRRAFAVIACLLWLLGAEVLPNLHLAFHGDDHTHGSDGAIIHVAHGDAEDDHGHDHEHLGHLGHVEHADAIELDDGPGALAIDHAPAGHASSGIAHHAAALHAPPPPLTQPLPVLRPALRLDIAHDDQLPGTQLARPTARGPPATA